MQGVVTDTTQAVVAGAKVSLVNDKTGIVTLKETNSSVRSFFDLADRGAYTVSVEPAGFSKFVQRRPWRSIRSRWRCSIGPS